MLKNEMHFKKCLYIHLIFLISSLGQTFFAPSENLPELSEYAQVEQD